MRIITIDSLSSFYHKTITFTSDEAQRVEVNPEIVLTSVNIHCYDNDAYYGNASGLDGIIRANSTIWFDSPCRPFDFLFKNETAGNNAKIVIIGTLPVRVR